MANIESLLYENGNLPYNIDFLLAKNDFSTAENDSYMAKNENLPSKNESLPSENKNLPSKTPSFRPISSVSATKQIKRSLVNTAFYPNFHQMQAFYSSVKMKLLNQFDREMIE